MAVSTYPSGWKDLTPFGVPTQASAPEITEFFKRVDEVLTTRMGSTQMEIGMINMPYMKELCAQLSYDGVPAPLTAAVRTMLRNKYMSLIIYLIHLCKIGNSDTRMCVVTNDIGGLVTIGSAWSETPYDDYHTVIIALSTTSDDDKPYLKAIDRARAQCSGRVVHYDVYDHENSVNLTLDHLKDAAANINETLGRGEHVLVHCRTGLSLSVAIVSAYLILYRNMHIHDVVRYIEKRRITSINSIFVRLLSQLAESVPTLV